MAFQRLTVEFINDPGREIEPGDYGGAPLTVNNSKASDVKCPLCKGPMNEAIVSGTLPAGRFGWIVRQSPTECEAFVTVLPEGARMFNCRECEVTFTAECEMPLWT